MRETENAALRQEIERLRSLYERERDIAEQQGQKIDRLINDNAALLECMRRISNQTMSVYANTDFMAKDFKRLAHECLKRIGVG